MIGTTRVSKQPDKGKTGVFPLDNGRWGYFRGGLIRFTADTREECEAKAATIAGKPITRVLP